MRAWNLSDWAALQAAASSGRSSVCSCRLWWLDSAPMGATVAYATAIGAVLGFALGTRASEWLGALLTSLW